MPSRVLRVCCGLLRWRNQGAAEIDDLMGLAHSLFGLFPRVPFGRDGVFFAVECLFVFLCE